VAIKLPPNGRGQGRVTQFKILGPHNTYGTDYVNRLIAISNNVSVRDYPQNVCLGSRDLCKCLQISSNISETLQNSDIITTDDC